MSNFFDQFDGGEQKPQQNQANFFDRFDASEEQQNLPQETMGAFERGAAGVGRFMTEIGQGAKQIGLEAGEALGIADEGTADAYQQKVAEEKALWDKYSEGDTAARAGEIGAAVGSAFIPFGAVAKGGQLLKGGAQAAGLGAKTAAGGNLLRTTAQAAGVGAVEAGLQPVYEGDSFIAEKAKQMGTGAAFGAGANVGLDALGRVVESINPRNVVAQFANKTADKVDEGFKREGREIVEKNRY